MQTTDVKVLHTKKNPAVIGRGSTRVWNSETNKQRHPRFSYLLKLWCADASHTKARAPRMHVHVIDVCDTAVSDKIVPTMLCIIAFPKNVFLFSMIIVFVCWPQIYKTLPIRQCLKSY